MLTHQNNKKYINIKKFKIYENLNFQATPIKKHYYYLFI
jgi:hypothetical protein